MKLADNLLHQCNTPDGATASGRLPKTVQGMFPIEHHCQTTCDFPGIVLKDPLTFEHPRRLILHHPGLADILCSAAVIAGFNVVCRVGCGVLAWVYNDICELG